MVKNYIALVVASNIDALDNALSPAPKNDNDTDLFFHNIDTAPDIDQLGNSVKEMLKCALLGNDESQQINLHAISTMTDAQCHSSVT